MHGNTHGVFRQVINSMKQPAIHFCLLMEDLFAKRKRWSKSKIYGSFPVNAIDHIEVIHSSGPVL
jgi:hypothetical protein